MPTTASSDSSESRSSTTSPRSSPRKEKASKSKFNELFYELKEAAKSAPLFWITSIVLFMISFFMGVAVEGWHVLTTVYAITQCVLTIGFGDFNVTHDATKLALSFMMLNGLVIAAFLANQLGDLVVKWHMEFVASKLASLESSPHGRTVAETRAMNRTITETLEEDRTTTHHGGRTFTETLADGVDDVHHAVASFTKYSPLVAASWPVIVCLFFGTVFYAKYEACTCSYGSSRRLDCSMESYDACVESGGYVKNWVDAFYMSVMTMTTVGLGDFSPRSELGRGIAIVWMIMGVACTGYLVKELAAFSFERKSTVAESQDVLSIDRNIFDSIDLDGNGTISRHEYRWYVVLKHNLVTPELMHSIDKTFDQIDQRNGKDGKITFEEIFEAQQEMEKLSSAQGVVRA